MAFSVVDLPVPLPPTMANSLFFGTAKFTPFRTSGASLLYLNQASFTITAGVPISSSVFSFPTRVFSGTLSLKTSDSQFLPSLTVSGHSRLFFTP